MPLNADEISEVFAGCVTASLIDRFSGYDQVSLDPESQDLTLTQTPLGLMKMTTLTQGATNSVARFQRIVAKILHAHMPHRALPFIDDIGVQGPKTDYDGVEIFPGIRQFVLEHIQWLDGVLADLEPAGCTVSGAKSQFCRAGLKIAGCICDARGRHPEHCQSLENPGLAFLF